MRVAIAGAGLGGLCLAQGLRRYGIDVSVYERDPDLATRRQGYRLHIGARGAIALRDCLPPELFDLFLATCGRPGTRFTVLSSQLRELRRIEGDPAAGGDDPATLSTSVNRLTLREVLLAGLGEQIRFGHELTGFADDGDAVTLRFADGTSATADLLVGADGVNSAVRQQLLPQANVAETGGRCIYGKTLLDDETLPLVPEALHHGFAAIVGGHLGLATGLVRLRNRPEVVAPDLLSPAADYLMWAVSGQQDRFPAELSTHDAAGLHRVAVEAIRSWHPHLRALVDRAEVDETFLVRVRTSEPVAAWAPSRVTVLGDAIHAMSPAGGSGANVALHDAAVLSRLLSEVVGGRVALIDAVGVYENQMREYGFAAVLASREAERRNISGGLGRVIAGLLNRLQRPNAGTGRPAR